MKRGSRVRIRSTGELATVTDVWALKGSLRFEVETDPVVRDEPWGSVSSTTSQSFAAADLEPLS